MDINNYAYYYCFDEAAMQAIAGFYDDDQIETGDFIPYNGMWYIPAAEISEDFMVMFKSQNPGVDFKMEYWTLSTVPAALRPF